MPSLKPASPSTKVQHVSSKANEGSVSVEGTGHPTEFDSTDGLWTWCAALLIRCLGRKRQFTVLVGLEQHVGLAQTLFPCLWSHWIHPPPASGQMKASYTKASPVILSWVCSEGPNAATPGQGGKEDSALSTESWEDGADKRNNVYF